MWENLNKSAWKQHLFWNKKGFTYIFFQWFILQFDCLVPTPSNMFHASTTIMSTKFKPLTFKKHAIIDYLVDYLTCCCLREVLLVQWIHLTLVGWEIIICIKVYGAGRRLHNSNRTHMPTLTPLEEGHCFKSKLLNLYCAEFACSLCECVDFLYGIQIHAKACMLGSLDILIDLMKEMVHAWVLSHMSLY